MGKRRRKNTIRTYRQKLADGRGQGQKASYKPGIYTYEIPSKGKTARVLGTTTGRVHHCLSQHEKYFLLLLDYDPEVTDIKEQYLLPLDDTLLIAADKGIEHPRANGVAAVMSTDFYYCKGGQWYAVAIKTTEDLKNARVQEKLEIEKAFWENMHTPWRVVTEKDISRQKATNLQWLHTGESVEKLIRDQEDLEKLSECFLELYEDVSVPFSDIIHGLESHCRLIPGTILQLFKHLVCEGKIKLDLSLPIYYDDPRRSARN